MPRLSHTLPADVTSAASSASQARSGLVVGSFAGDNDVATSNSPRWAIPSCCSYPRKVGHAVRTAAMGGAHSVPYVKCCLSVAPDDGADDVADLLAQPLLLDGDGGLVAAAVVQV